MKKFYLILAVGAVFAFVGLLSWAFLGKPEVEVSSLLSESDHVLISDNKREEKLEKVTLLFVGDIMLARAIGSISERKNDPLFYFRSTKELVEKADIAIANLESPLSTRGTKMGSEISFHARPVMADGLLFAGFDVVSLANNHIWDYGPEALLDTLDILREKNILYAGAGKDYVEAHAPAIRDVRGVRVAFLSYTNLIGETHTRESSAPAVAFADQETIKADIVGARKKANVVVVLFHWGDEYETRHNAFQENLAHAAIDAGARIVIGHHPHVVEEVEEYNGGLIAYSLGNFIFDQNFSEDTSRGLVIRITLTGQDISSVEKIPVFFSRSFELTY